MDAAHAQLIVSEPAPGSYQPDSILEASTSRQLILLEQGQIDSEYLVQGYLARIEALNRQGPELNAIIAVMPDALEQAQRLDQLRRSGKILGPLHGIPIIIKDNIEAAGPIATTAGSSALEHNVTNRDAFIVQKLKNAGAIILAKANLSQWANIRSTQSLSGWSSIGGLVKNPHLLSHNACGSSSGSAVATAANLASAAIGTETDGSIICPAAINGIVGFKPSMGLVSRRHIVPISHSQDIAGPMTKTIEDAALILSVISGSDPQDPATDETDQRKRDYAAGLDGASIEGVRIGILRDRIGENLDIQRAFQQSIERLRIKGAILIDIEDSQSGLEELNAAEFSLLLHELVEDMAKYLAATPKQVDTKNLADLIAWNIRHRDEEMPWFGQEIFEMAQQRSQQPDAERLYLEAKQKAQLLASNKFDQLMLDHRVTFLVGPSNGLHWANDLLNGDHFAGPSQSQLPAIAGYPHLTLPIGSSRFKDGDGKWFSLPLGLSIIGKKWHDQQLLEAGHAIMGFSKIIKAQYVTHLDGRNMVENRKIAMPPRILKPPPKK